MRTSQICVNAGLSERLPWGAPVLRRRENRSSDLCRYLALTPIAYSAQVSSGFYCGRLAVKFAFFTLLSQKKLVNATDIAWQFLGSPTIQPGQSGPEYVVK